MKRLAWLCLLILGATLAAPARADDGERAWATGVGQAEQAAALALFQAGNALFTESQYAAALGRYREALKLWDHPAIRYNAAVALINLDQPLPAYEHLEAALAYGETPLGTENHRQALLYKKLLSGQLSELEVVCSEPSAEVMLDGELLFRAPGSARRRLLPGAHQLAGRKPGFLTEAHSLQLSPGKPTKATLVLAPIQAPRMRSVRNWPVWQPWAVLGAGAALGLAGVPFYVDARNNLEDFDSELARLCPAGCTESELPESVSSARTRAKVENGVAIGLFAAGGAMMAAGATLLYLNQPRLEPEVSPRRRNAPKATTGSTSARISIVPVLAPKHAGLSARLAY